MKNLCPRCLEGEVFRDFLTMNKECPHCSYLFKKGHGYFTGSLVINYSICVILLMPIFLTLVIAESPTWMVIGLPLALLLLLQPFMVRYSRLMWLHMDYKMVTAKN